MLPEMGIIIFILNKGSVKKREKVNKLVQATIGADAFSKDIVMANKVTVHEVLNHITEMAVIGNFQFFCYFLTGETFLGSRKKFNDGFITLGTLE